MENVIIIGSGPAACTAALYTARANLSPLVLEGELSQTILPGGQLMTTTDIENFPGFPEPLSGAELVGRIKKQAEKFGARMLGKTVTAVDFSKCPLTLWSGDESWQTQSVIIATGATARYLGLPSEQTFMNRGVSACATCDGALPRFRNAPIVVVGGGDTAMEEALFLARFASRVHIVHRRDALRASRIMAARVLEHPKITIEWNTVLEEILGDDDQGVMGVRLRDVHTGEIRELTCPGVFLAIGHKPTTELFRGILDMDETGYLITQPNSTYTNIPGVFAAGDVQDHVYRQAITAAGSGCMAALDCTRWLETQGA